VKAANLAAKFTLELAALAAFAYWGGTVGSGAVSVLIAICAPLLVAVLWGMLAAPNASRRLPVPARIPFELAVFGLAAVALGSALSVLAGLLFAIAAIVNAALLTTFDQWEQ
jgi:hypothetical protein